MRQQMGLRSGDKASWACRVHVFQERGGAVQLYPLTESDIKANDERALNCMPRWQLPAAVVRVL